MATFALDSTLIYYDDIDFGQYSNTVTVNTQFAEHDVTNFGSGGWSEMIAGNGQGDFSIGGFWGFTDPDSITWTAVNAAPASPAITCTPTGTEGETAYLFQPLALSRSTGGNVGDPAAVTLTGKSKSPVYGGGLTLAKQTITGDTNGTGIQFTAGIAATELVGVAVHCFVDNGTSLDVILERDDNAGFTTATTVTTIAVSATGSQWYQAAGPGGSDDYWRVRTANLVGTSFDIAAAIGVAN